MEKEIDIKVKGKNKPMPIILAVYWRMLLKAVEGDDRMMLAVIALRNELMKEHREANFDLVQAIDDIEINLTRDGHVLDDETLKSLNEARRRTRGSS